ncbi:hypothetical protein CCU68_19225 [Pseudomonas gingeri NCPPB 3146 = LMG 5327]|uniref:HrpA n=2 Tax=Pseudomonas gingeri TaxID=117681 RepID=A0A7Y7Y5E9_9PSED|nr:MULTISPECIES: hypothetical protein [Pseudomonas]NVZ28560.1 hypothetical protein [Pseudomonas gingeri]NVZ62658.1 hypothetical protein [Pseudomonas gingeri]NVZ76604.1 hypothetical protein [Pseudomonas gingeri]NWA08374.1 hypothetical protein [Pseudomonas gingeri]NWC18183.1 hypothetical protein [Pseudomonas gingeri]
MKLPGIGGMVNSAVNGFNSVKETANSIQGNAQNQSAAADLSGGGKAADAQMKMMQMQDEQSARNIMLQGQAAMQTEQRNTLQAISSAQTDAANKEISNVAQTAKGISY